MKKHVTLALALAAALTLGGCDHMTQQQQRALSGGALGTAAGLGIGILAGAPLAGAALIGGAGGAVLGAISGGHSH